MFREYIVFNNGEKISVQAGNYLYSTPPEDADSYTAVEVGNIDHIELPEDWEDYSDWYEDEPPSGDNFAVYAWVPVQMVLDLVVEKGGIKSGILPPLQVDKFPNVR